MFPATGLPGGGGGNTPREREIRQAIRTIKKLRPTATAERISQILWSTEHVRRSPSAIKSQLRREGCPTTVPRRISYHKKNVARDAHFLRLVVGTLPLLKDGTRGNRHSNNVARAIINDGDEKYNHLDKKSAVAIISTAGYYSAVRRVGPGITELNNTQRRSFYYKFRRYTALQWQLVCFSDAHTLSPNHISNPRNERVVVPIGTSPPSLKKVRRNDARAQPALHTYGCLTRYGICGPYFVEGKLNSATYQSEVLDHLLPDLEAKHGDGEDFILMQDNAGEHISKSTQAYFSKVSVVAWPPRVWPGNSPDLNPIEGFWPLLRHAVTPPGVYGLSNTEMRRRATVWFSKVTVAQCRVAMSGMVNRMRELSAAKFWSIAH